HTSGPVGGGSWSRRAADVVKRARCRMDTGKPVTVNCKPYCIIAGLKTHAPAPALRDRVGLATSPKQARRLWCRVEFAIEVFMKRMLSRMVVASGVLLGTCVVSVSHAAEAVAKPDAAKGEQLYVNGDMARGVIACASCHGEAGNSVIPINPNLSGQPYEYLVKQLLDFKPKGDH